MGVAIILPPNRHEDATPEAAAAAHAPLLEGDGSGGVEVEGLAGEGKKLGDAVAAEAEGEPATLRESQLAATDVTADDRVDADRLVAVDRPG